MQTDFKEKKFCSEANGLACVRAALSVNREARADSGADPGVSPGRRRLCPVSGTERRLHFEDAQPLRGGPPSKRTPLGRLWETLKKLCLFILSFFCGRPFLAAPAARHLPSDSDFLEERVPRVSRKVSTSTIESDRSFHEAFLALGSLLPSDPLKVLNPKLALGSLLDCSIHDNTQLETSNCQKRICALQKIPSQSNLDSPVLVQSPRESGRRGAQWLDSRLRESLRLRLRVDCKDESSDAADFDAETGRFQTTFGKVVSFSPNKVFLAQHKLEDKLYIVRKVNFPRGFRGPSGRERVREVLESLQRLSHPNLAKYVTAWVEEEAPSTPAADALSLPDKHLLSPVTVRTLKSAPEMEDENLFSSKTFRQPSLPSAAEINDKVRPFHADIDLEVEFGQPAALSISTTSLSSFEEDLLESSKPSLKLYVQYEYCQGMSIGSLLSHPGAALEDEEVFAVAAEALSAIGYLHSQGLSLGKLSQDNVFIDDDGSVKLVRSMTPQTPHAPVEAQEDFADDLANLGLLIYQLLGQFKTTHEGVTMARRARQSRSLPLDDHRRLGSRAAFIEALLGARGPLQTAAALTAHPSFVHWQSLVSAKVAATSVN